MRMPIILPDPFRFFDDLTYLHISVDHLHIGRRIEITTALSGKTITLICLFNRSEPAKEQKQIARFNACIIQHSLCSISLSECRLPVCYGGLSYVISYVGIEVALAIFLSWFKLSKNILVCIIASEQLIITDLII